MLESPRPELTVRRHAPLSGRQHFLRADASSACWTHIYALRVPRDGPVNGGDGAALLLRESGGARNSRRQESWCLAVAPSASRGRGVGADPHVGAASETEGDSGRCPAAGGRHHEARDAGSLRKPEKARKRILPWSLQKGTQPCPHLDLGPARPMVDTHAPGP